MKIRFVGGCVLNGKDYSAGDIIEVDGTEKGLDVVFGAGLAEVLVEIPEEAPDGTPEGTTETPAEPTEGEDPTDEPHEVKSPVRTKRKKK